LASHELISSLVPPSLCSLRDWTSRLVQGLYRRDGQRHRRSQRDEWTDGRVNERKRAREKEWQTTGKSAAPPIVQQFVRLFGRGGEKKMSVWHITVTRYWPATDGSMFLSPIFRPLWSGKFKQRHISPRAESNYTIHFLLLRTYMCNNNRPPVGIKRVKKKLCGI
jgi:hypothetical protein